jgi:hypothetical protein
MPFRHVVMFQWAEGLGVDHVQRVRDGLNALPAQIEQIRSYVHGHDLGVTDGNFDYVLVADFDSEADFLVYRTHPVHLQFIEDVITGNTARRASVQYET